RISTEGITQATTKDVTVTNPDGKSFTLENGLVLEMPPVQNITDVEFSEQFGRKIMTIKGTALFENSYVGMAANGKFVTLNNVVLPSCAMGTGYTAEQHANMGGRVPANVSDTPTCLFIRAFQEGPTFTPTPNKLVIWLAEDFDITKPGSLTIN